MREKNKGITLIALIITIIVLLILAAVTVATLTGENGLLERASRARIYNRKASAEEELMLSIEEVQVFKRGEATIQDILDEFKKDTRKDIEVIEVVTGEVATISCEIPQGNVEEITVIVDKYKEFSFTIGDSCEITKICGIAKNLWNGQTLNNVGSSDRITIEATPESQTASYVGNQEVAIKVTNSNKWTTWQAQTAWSTSSETAPTQGWETLTLNDGSSEYEKTAEVTNVGEQEQSSYYLWVRITTGTATKTQKFGPYNIESVPTQSNFICRVTEKRKNDTEGTLLVGTTEVFENWTLKYKVNTGEETTITGATTTTTVKQGDIITLKYTRTGYTDVIKTVTIDELVTDSLTASLTFNNSNELTEGTIATLSGTSTIGVANVELKIGSYTVYSETIANSQASYSKQLSIDDMNNLTNLTFNATHQAQLIITGVSGSTQNSSTVTVTNYIIGTETQLKALATSVNSGTTFQGKTIYQIADIALNSSENFTPIGYKSSTNKTFNGTYNGNNKNITDLYINTSTNYQGLFGYVNGGTIKNLTVNGNVSGGSGSAGLVAYINNGTIDSCVNKVNVSNKNNSIYYGGYYGYNVTSIGGITAVLEGTVTIRNTNNEGTISLSASNGIGARDIVAGGIVGWITNQETGLIIENSNNYGEVRIDSISTSIQNSYIGGIAGVISGGIVRKCHNTANITSASTNNISGYSYTGGIAGHSGILSSNSNNKIEECWNSGIIKSALAGGINGCNADGYKITNCYNTGNIKQDYRYGIGSTASPAAGGICAWNTSNSTIEKCYNKGVIDSNGCYTTTSGEQIGSIGGIIGWNDDGASINKCYNCGTLNANPRADTQDRRGAVARRYIRNYRKCKY